MKLILKSLLIAVVLGLMFIWLINLTIWCFRPILSPFIVVDRSVGVEYTDNRPTEPEIIKLVPPPLE